MRGQRQTILLFAVSLLLIAANALSIDYHVGRLSNLRQEYLDLERQISELMKEQKATTLEYWMLHELGTYPRNASIMGMTDGINATVFYPSNISEEDLALKFNPLAETLNMTVTHLSLTDQENVELLNEIFLKTGFPEPNPSQSYVILLNPSKIICLKLEQVTDEVFRRCVEYLAI